MALIHEIDYKTPGELLRGLAKAYRYPPREPLPPFWTEFEAWLATTGLTRAEGLLQYASAELNDESPEWYRSFRRSYDQATPAKGSGTVIARTEQYIDEA